MQTAIKNIRRSPYQALAAIFIVTLTVFIIGAFTLVSAGSQQILLTFETKPQIIAYLKDGHTQEQVLNLITTLSNTEGVKKAIYISKEDALSIYKKSVGNDPILLGTVTDWGIVTADILPASIEITAKDPNMFPSVSSILEASDIVSTTPQGRKEIDYPKDVVEELTKWTGGIRIGGLILVAALIVVSVVTIIMIISMKIASRRLEIKTLKLMGAKNFFIIKPYLDESIIYGLSGSFLGWLFVFIAALYSTPFLAPRLSGIITFPIPLEIYLILLGIMLVFGWLLALISGYFAAIRFLKRSK